MLADAAPDLGQHLGEFGKAAGFARFTNALPVGMIAILQPAGGIAADGLDVSLGIGGIKDVFIGGRNRERRKALYFFAANGTSLRTEVAKTAAMTKTANC